MIAVQEDMSGQCSSKVEPAPGHKCNMEARQEHSGEGVSSEENGEGAGEGSGQGSEKGDCCCLCYDPAGADSGCVSDVSSGADGGLISDEVDSNQPHSSDSCDAHSDSSSQHSHVSLGSQCSDGTSAAIFSMPPPNMPYTRNYQLKVTKPMKDIPPRFQKIISQNPSIRRTKFEGTPLVRHGRMHRIPSMPTQCNMAEFENVNNSGGGVMQHNFNPHAQTFVPGQRYDCGEVMGSGGGDGSMMVAVPDNACYVCPEGSECSMTCASACNGVPTYTIHIYNVPHNGQPPNSSGAASGTNSVASTSPSTGLPPGGGSYMYPSAPPPSMAPAFMPCPPPVPSQPSSVFQQPPHYAQYTPPGQY